MSSYQIEKTSLWLDIRSVLSSGKKPIKFDYKGMLHTEKEDIAVLKLISIDTVRDYVNKISDHVHVEFQMPLGDYITRLYPYRNNLEFSIKKIELEEVSNAKQADVQRNVERYKAIFLFDQNPNIAASDLNMYDSESLNKLDIITVKLDLVNRSIEPLRIKTVSGVFRNVSQKQLIHNLLAGESNKVLVDGKPSTDGIDIVEPDNTKVNQHAIVKSGTHITAIPTYLQQHMGGVYNADIGTYLQTYNNKRLWFVYPLYKLNRFTSNVGKVIFYSLPRERFPGLDRTYSQEGSIIKILVTSERKYKDTADVDYMNHGSGFRMANANSFMKKPVELGPDGPVARRTNLNYEVAIEDRKDGLNYAPVTNNGISSNPFLEYSKVSARNAARIDLVWENSNQDLIYPNMPCKYVFLDKGKIVELSGVILFVHAYTALQGTGINNNVYRSLSQITIVTEKYKETPNIPNIKTFGEF